MCRKRVGLTGEQAGMKGLLMKRILELQDPLVVCCQIYELFDNQWVWVIFLKKSEKVQILYSSLLNVNNF